MSEQPLTSTFTKLRKRFFSQALHILHNEDDADDVLQDAFCRLWQRRDKIRSREEAEAMATTTVHNLCVDNLRKQIRMQQVDIDEEHSDLQADTSISEKMDEEERFGQVEAIINSKLSPVQQKIVKLREYEGKSFDEIARMLNLQAASVRVQLSRSRKIIRECYQKQSEQ